MGQQPPKGSRPIRIPVEEHDIDIRHISACATRIISTLNQRGYEAYVVGGAVRDLLLGFKPKDFDVVTGATPEQVRRVFGSSRIIGRRFRLVHVYCGGDLVEVSTFRAPHDTSDTQDRKGRVLRDNTFGSINEDAIRRDFTVNALFYDMRTEEVLDFCGGYEDTRQSVLRIIGAPMQRYREDPVRMLRAIRLSEKLDLTIDSKTKAPFKKLATLLGDVPTARLYDEFIKIIKSGSSASAVEQIVTHGFHVALFKKLGKIKEKSEEGEFLQLVFQKTDERINSGKSVSPAFVFAAVLWADVQKKWNYVEGDPKYMGTLARSIDDVCDGMGQTFIPKRLIADVRDIWYLQGRLLARKGKKPAQTLRHGRFRAGYDFLELRGFAGEVAEELVEWWRYFQELPLEDQDSWLERNNTVDSNRSVKRGRRRTRKKPSTNIAALDE
ncbi:MAG: polynucleotide adenylyltransferase PcnB [Proteobacteria bacterium]|nr:polynucleotide adenylyltransferase PcnB [Pseudomonadota bacterium]